MRIREGFKISKQINFSFLNYYHTRAHFGISAPLKSSARHWFKKLLLQSTCHFYGGVQNQFQKQEMELSKQEIELFSPISRHQIKIGSLKDIFDQPELGLGPRLITKIGLHTHHHHHPPTTNFSR